MEKIYYEDQYVRSFTAEVVEIKEVDERFHVVLDKTAFFPGGGGQFCDNGTIEKINVIDVYEKDGTVYHVLEKNLIKKHKVKCEIDWERRQDGMHQHLAQHVLSGCFFTLFNANTVSFHLGSEFSTVDIKGILEEEKIREGEKLANDVIGKNLIVESFVPLKKELKKIKLRRALPKTDEEIRVLKVGDLDINACCGVHPNNTMEIRMIKIIKYEKNKGNTRIEFLAGKRAVDDSLKKDRFSSEICRYLSSSEEESINSIKNLNEEIKGLVDENKKIRDIIAGYEIKEMIDKAIKIGDISVVKKIYENENAKYVNKIASKLVEQKNIVSLLAIKNKDRVNLIFACSKNLKNVNMNELLKDSITLIDGKGGGSQFLAQGGGKNNMNLQSSLDYALGKIKNNI
ncbi:alanyl-tRNA editing protein AlaX-L [Clostridium senegalense]|uniref:alanyl-tRNA editing protein n=1 Tax=Clostridium senegalense TaxID=1465809 RepID=UPI001C114C12|nr:DHHA1 domain-containing protein [Clostridium senegalense]MBU5227162.1 alanyl-tRNA editing protein AlaX-L [Clostridium senegalense]